ncbi:MAG: transcriptional regulator [Flavobacteriales bacterium]|nr:transcriptional regulator [Flavobacteriales bacterium]
MELKQVEKISKALSDINRLKILQSLQANNGKLECISIVSFLNLAQPSISHHIKKLVEADLIEPHKEGRYHFYSLNTDVWDNYMETLKKL